MNKLLRAGACAWALAGLAACVTPLPGPPRPPIGGPSGSVRYSCDNGARLIANYHVRARTVTVSTAGQHMTLPLVDPPPGFYYSNGTHGLRGQGGGSVRWEVGRMAPITCVRGR